MSENSKNKSDQQAGKTTTPQPKDVKKKKETNPNNPKASQDIPLDWNSSKKQNPSSTFPRAETGTGKTNEETH